MTGKACKTHEATVMLAERGFGQDAGLLLRSLLDLVVNALWLAKDPCQRMEMWLEFDWILRQRIPLSLEKAEENKETVDTIEIEARRVKEKYGYKRGDTWSRKSIESMAREVGLGDLYKYAYRTLSNIEHSASRGFVSYHVDTPDGIRINIGPGKEYVKEVLVTACDLLVDLLTLANDVLALDLNSVLEEARRNLSKIIHGDKLSD